MSKKFLFLVFFGFLPFFLLSAKISFASGPAAEYLCEMGTTLYSMGKFDDALEEFNKALLIDPENKVAKQYISDIFKKSLNPPVTSSTDVSLPPKKEELPKEKPPIKQASVVKQDKPVAKSPKVLTKDEVMEQAMFSKEKPFIKQVPEVKQNKPIVESPRVLTKDEVMAQAMSSFGKKDSGEKSYPSGFNPFEANLSAHDEEKGIMVGPLKISGSTQVSFGVNSNNDFYWKRANYDLNQRDSRMLSDAALNRRFNTYDPGIYDSLSVNVDTDNKEGLNFHSNITVDPWSFTGKSDKVTVTSAFGDAVELQLRYWSNTGYTVSQVAYSKIDGNTFLIPELKVENGKTDPFTSLGAFWPSDSINVSGMKIYREFQPARELWFDYVKEESGVKLRVFPMAYQDQAYTSDDPLQITNHHIWWGASPWIKRYVSGNYNSGGTPDYTKGFWDDTYSNLRDSTGKYLTALRGFSLGLGSTGDTSFDATVATPKDLWQDYATVDNFIATGRLKHYFTDDLMLGATFTSRIGMNLDMNNEIDNQNYVGGADLSYEVFDGLKAQAEVLTSKSFNDETNSTYKTETRGNAYYFTITDRYPQKSIMDLADAYNQIKYDKEEPFLLKSKFFVAHLDAGFDTALSEYKDTRDDAFWGRHISFRKSHSYFYTGLAMATLDQNAIDASRIGNGIDVGRNAFGFRLEGFIGENFSNLFDMRSVGKTNGKYVETVFRDEIMFKPTNKLTLRGLGLYQNLPNTVGGIDPFDIDPDTGIGLANPSVPDGEDPSVTTGSLGLEYAFKEWLSANFVWERTNDYYLAYGNYPNGLFNNAELSNIYYQDGNAYRSWRRALYSQGIFPQAPYSFYNIYKAGINFIPIDKLSVYMDYTYNDFDYAGQISDTMNHAAIEFIYEPTSKLGFGFKYTYSRWKNPYSAINGSDKMTGHHNFFGEFRYLPSKDDELSLQYGVGGYSVVSGLYDPTGGSLLSIDTQHIIRAYYRHKF